MEKKTRRNFDVMTMTLRSHSMKEPPLCPPAIIQTLPEEVLIEIFSYLSLGELCNTVSKVCTQWERLHWDRQLYRLPRVLEGEGSIEDLFECLDKEPHLASPYFDQVYMKEIIRKCIETRHEVKHRTVELKEMLMILSHLRVVKFTEKCEYSWKKVATLMRCCVQLEELEVGCHSVILINNADLKSLCDHLCDTLRVLHVDYCEWRLEGGRALTKCRLLEDLAIHASGNLSAGWLLEVAKMSSLRRLKIHSYLVSSNTWISMFSNKTLKGLTHLHLRCTYFSPEAAVAIGTNLTNLTDLYIYTLSKGSIGNNGFRAIIQGCNKLTSLELRRYEGLMVVNDLMTIPIYLPRLQTLALDAVVVRSQHTWRSELQEKMPNLVIK